MHKAGDAINDLQDRLEGPDPEVWPTARLSSKPSSPLPGIVYRSLQGEKIEAMRSAVLNAAFPTGHDEGVQWNTSAQIDDLTAKHMRPDLREVSSPTEATATALGMSSTAPR